MKAVRGVLEVSGRELKRPAPGLVTLPRECVSGPARGKREGWRRSGRTRMAPRLEQVPAEGEEGDGDQFNMLLGEWDAHNSDG